MPELSVVIITYNEEKNIGRCLESVREVADDVVVVDSFSTDNTEKICLEHGARFIRHPFFGYIEQKNWAITQARYPHILSLDADEALSPRLVKNIQKVKQNWKYDGYSFNRLTNYCGRWIRHGSWYPDRKLRLWDSRKGAWRGMNPHDRFELYKGGRSRFIRGDLLHYSYYSRADHHKQVNRFSDILSKAYYTAGRTAGLSKRYLHPIWRFSRDYFLKLGFLDGRDGFFVARMAAVETRLKYQKLHKLEQDDIPVYHNTVCFFNGTPSWGGGEKWHYDMSCMLDEKGYQVLVITGWKSILNRKIRQSGINSLELWVSNFSFLNFMKRRRLTRVFRSQGVRSIIINRSADMKLAGPAARKAGVEQIIYRRGSAIPVSNSFLNRWLFRHVLTDVIANSEETRRTLLLKNPNLFDPSRIRVIYNGIELPAEPVKPATGSYREDGMFMLGNAGRLSFEKGHQYLIELGKLLKEKGMPFRILVAGKGDLDVRLRSKAIEAGVFEEVRFIGFVENMQDFYRSLDGFLLTSLWEGFGYVLVEAMAHRLPVVTFDIGSSSEIVIDGQTGFILPERDVQMLADRVIQLYQDPALRGKMGAAGRKLVEERFTISLGVSQVEELLAGARRENVS